MKKKLLLTIILLSIYGLNAKNGIPSHTKKHAINNSQYSQSGIDVKIYPLPFLDKLTIESQTIGTVSLFNVLGDIVIQQPIKSGILELQTTNLSNGIYILKITQGESVFIKKIMKN